MGCSCETKTVGLASRYAHRFGILLSAESLTGLLCIVTVAKGLDRSYLWEGLSEGSIVSSHITD